MLQIQDNGSGIRVSEVILNLIWIPYTTGHNLTLSLPKIVCSGFSLFPKELCRWVKLARNIHFLELGLS